MFSLIFKVILHFETNAAYLSCQLKRTETLLRHTLNKCLAEVNMEPADDLLDLLDNRFKTRVNT